VTYPIEDKFVIAIASSALFDLEESDRVFREQGRAAYKKYQSEHEDAPLGRGMAFPFIKRLLKLNEALPEDRPVEVVLLSKNDPNTGLRVFNSIEHYGLDIRRAAFRQGASIHGLIESFNAKLFLSANEADVKEAIVAGHAAGCILESEVSDLDDDFQLRIAFDFDGVLVDDSSEQVFQKSGSVEEFHAHETAKALEPISPGPLKPLLHGIAKLQEAEARQLQHNPDYEPCLRTAIITARCAPSHKRVIHTLRDWGIEVDEAFFLGGIAKDKILDSWKPHIFFDDQLGHLDRTRHVAPSVHIPFGVVNTAKGAV
jgi:5'-nucleotidase